MNTQFAHVLFHATFNPLSLSFSLSLSFFFLSLSLSLPGDPCLTFSVFLSFFLSVSFSIDFPLSLLIDIFISVCQYLSRAEENKMLRLTGFQCIRS